MKFTIIYLTIISISVFSSQIVEAFNPKFRLPTTIQPIKYKLELLVDVHHQWPDYEERVHITVKCVEEKTDEISVNVKSSDLIIDEKKVRVKVFESDPELIIGVRNHVPDTDKETHIFQLEDFLEVDQIYEVLIPFKKAGSQIPKGYFLDQQENTSNSGQKYIVTQLGPGDARGIFPCLDQIHLKAQFRVFLKHPENYWGFSNVKKLNTKPVADTDNLFVEDEFDESPPMSTNNIAFVLINSKMFKPLDLPEALQNGLIQLYATETVINYMYFADEATIQIMRFYSDFFRSQYPLRQLTMIALPDFHDIDREKYGIVTLKDSSIAHPDESGQVNVVDAVLYICHSMSQQWLGTRVALSSWNIYWLQKAFVYLLEKPCVENIFPEQRFSYFDTRLSKTFTSLLQYEVDATSYTMLDFDYFDEINTFDLEDPIIAKAFCLVQMLSFSFGEEILQNSMVSYMETPSSTRLDLQYVGTIFSKIVNDSKKLSYDVDVYQFLNSWISRAGFPLIKVTRTKKGKGIHIVQKNFKLFYDPDEALIFDNACWMMPLRFTTSNDLTPDNNKVHHWLDCNKPFTALIDAKKNDWMVLDLRLNVLCRINYDQENWDLIRDLGTNPDEYLRINVLSRVQLLSDMFALSENEIITYERLFETIKFLIHENHFLPMTVAANDLLKIRSLLFGSEIFFLFQGYVRNIMKVKFDKHGAGKTEDSSQTMREKYQFERLIIKMSCLFGVKQCQTLGNKVFKTWLTGGKEEEEVEDDREAFYCQAMMTATMEDWKFLWRKYNIKVRSQFNDDILAALGCSTKDRLLNYYVHWIIKKMDHRITAEDGPKVFESLAMNRKGYPLMKTFVLKHFKEIEIFTKNSSVSVDFYLKKLLDITKNTQDLNDLQTFITQNYENTNDFETNIRRAKRNIWWLEKHTEKLTSYFSTHSLSSGFEQKV